MTLTLQQAEQLSASAIRISDELVGKDAERAVAAGTGGNAKGGYKLALRSWNKVETQFMQKLQAEAQKILGRPLTEDELDIRVTRPRALSARLKR